jgi:hypothetical protein
MNDEVALFLAVSIVLYKYAALCPSDPQASANEAMHD